MEGFWEALVSFVTSGGVHAGDRAVDILLGAIIFFLLKERSGLKEQLRQKEERIDKIVEDYYRGNITLTDALNSLKLVLYELKGKLS